MLHRLNVPGVRLHSHCGALPQKTAEEFRGARFQAAAKDKQAGEAVNDAAQKAREDLDK